jgi:alcohol dehydrogenase class IV
MTPLTANWNYPNAIRAGQGRINELAHICRELNINAPLLVTDPGLAKLPMVLHVDATCKMEGLACAIFSDIQSNPNGENISAGVKAYLAGSHDGVIAFGGGSALDAGKAIALMVGQQRPIWDYEDVGDNWLRVDDSKIAPIIAVPTTAGTGSEVGRASVITDEANHVKKIIFHPKMLPEVVILDPKLTLGLPANITAATGMDALSHCLEAFCSNYYHPMAEGIALEGIRLIKEFLPVAVKDGQNINARMQMLVASTMGATAFQRGLGAMHAIAHSLGAVYGAHHGLLNAILMPYVLQANRSEIEVRITRLSHYLQLDMPGFDSFLAWVLDLQAQLFIPSKLSEINIGVEKIELLAQMAFDDPSAAGNPISFTVAQYKHLIQQAVLGH